MAILKVIKMGNPLLREICKPISTEEIATPEFQKFLDDLRETMNDESGAGIAAPQVGILKRVFVMGMDKNARYPMKEAFPLTFAINPEIIVTDSDATDSWEGCLSIPNIRGKLVRHANIILRALDRDGKTYSKELTGFAAIVAQHELDHLNGVLFIDRMENMESLSFLEEYRKYWEGKL